MSDVTIGFITLPFLVLLTLAMEGTRLGCTRLLRRLHTLRKEGAVAKHATEQR